MWKVSSKTSIAPKSISVFFKSIRHTRKYQTQNLTQQLKLFVNVILRMENDPLGDRSSLILG